MILEPKLVSKIFDLSVFKDIAKVFITLFFTSYILYTLFSIVPGQKTYFTNYEFDGWDDEYLQPIQYNIIFDQPIIFKNYLEWMKNAVNGDFGNISHDDYEPLAPYMIDNIINSFRLVFLGIIISLALSLLFIFLYQYPFIYKNFIEPLISMSMLHLLFIAFFLFEVGVRSGLPYSVAVAISISFGGGVFYDYFIMLRDMYEKVSKKDYIIFAVNSGFKKYKHILAEFLINLITITFSRIPILFSGLIMLEVYKPELEGVGYLIWRSIQTSGDVPPSFHAVYSVTIILILFFSVLFLLTEHIRQSLSPKEYK